MKDIVLSILKSSIYLIPQLIILAACIYYLTKKNSTEAFLLFFGSLFGLLIRIFHLVVVPILIQQEIIDPIAGRFKIITVVSLLSLLAGLTFSIGFLMLVQKIISKMKNPSSETLDGKIAV